MTLYLFASFHLKVKFSGCYQVGINIILQNAFFFIECSLSSVICVPITLFSKNKYDCTDDNNYE